MALSTGTARSAATDNFSRVDHIKKLPYKPTNVKLADIKKAVNTVIKQRRAVTTVK